MSELHVSLDPNVITQIGGFALKNTHITFTGILIIILIYLVYSSTKFSSKPGKFQIVLEELYTFFASKIEITWISKKKKKILISVILTLFILIIISNSFWIAPILGSILYAVNPETSVNLFRTPTSDFSLTIALGVFVIIGWNIMALTVSPLRYIGNFIRIGWLFKARSLPDIGMVFLDIFLWLMDIIGELAKVFSVSARLFWNIIAWEIIWLVMLSLAPYFIPIPFFFLSFFSGLIQAFVFALLSMQFIIWSIENVGIEAQD